MQIVFHIIIQTPVQFTRNVRKSEAFTLAFGKMKPRNYDEQVKKPLFNEICSINLFTIIMQYAATKENFSHNFISVKKSGRDILTIFF